MILFSRVLTGTLCCNHETNWIPTTVSCGLEPPTHVVTSTDMLQFFGIAGCVRKCVWWVVRSHRYWECTQPGGVPKVHIAELFRTWIPWTIAITHVHHGLISTSDVVQLVGTGIVRFISKIPKCALVRGDQINVAHCVVPHVKWPYNVFQLNLTTSNRRTIYLVLRNCTGKLLLQETVIR